MVQLKFKIALLIAVIIAALFLAWPGLALAQGPVAGTCTLDFNEWSAGVDMGSGDLSIGDWRTINAAQMPNNFYYISVGTDNSLYTYLESRNNTGNNNGGCPIATDGPAYTASFGCSSSPFSVELRLNGDGCMDPEPVIEQCIAFPAYSDEDYPWAQGSGDLTPGDWRQVNAELMPNGFYYLLVTTEVTTTIHARNNTGDNSAACSVSPDDEENTYFSYGCSDQPFSVELQIEDNGCDFGQNCTLVENADFITDTVWLLDNGAVISDSILSLPVSGAAAQNLTLDSSTTYTALISTTSIFSGESSIFVRLGTDYQSVTITQTGQYTAAFTTPTLSGPLAYSLENTGPDAIDLDFVCLYSGDQLPDAPSDCIAPVNGTFDTADDWTYLRDATWYSPAKEAFIPASTVGLLVSSSVYSLPTLTTGENLLLSFTSRKLSDDTGGITGRVKGVSGVNFTYELYDTDYTFETSLNSLAGETSAEVAFVNPGLEGSTIFSGTADLALDNICIFVADRGPNLPTPTDPNATPPVDLGFNWTSCSTVDGILAGFGVNMAQYRADYAAGASVWDPIGWVLWLISAGWVILASWLCLFMAAFVTIVDILEYIINNLLNVFNWWVRSFPAFILWLGGWGDWIAATLANLSDAYGAFLADWADWIGAGLAYISDVIGLTLAAAMEWLGNSLAALANWIGDTLAALWAWLSTYLLNLNGLRTIVNWLIAGWNLFLDAVGVVWSSVIDLAVNLWNNSLLPVLQAVWDYLSGFSLIALIADLVIGFVVAAFNLFYMVAVWMWENVFMVVSLPLQVYYGFTEGTQSAAFDALIACSAENWYCTFLAGLQVVNQTVGATILYPIVIAGIIIATIGIFWRSIWKMFTIEIA